MQQMPKLTYRTCRVCGRSTDEVGPMSHSRLCPEDSQRLFLENMSGMLTMQGHFATHWRRRMAASVGAVLVDEPRSAS